MKKTLSIWQHVKLRATCALQFWGCLLYPGSVAVVGGQLRRRVVVLDHRYFLNATLRECDVYYFGGPVTQQGLTMIDCQAVTFMGAAARTVLLLQQPMRGSADGGTPLEFPMLRHAINAKRLNPLADPA